MSVPKSPGLEPEERSNSTQLGSMLAMEVINPHLTTLPGFLEQGNRGRQQWQCRIEPGGRTAAMTFLDGPLSLPENQVAWM
jgi:hypothetical protein